MPEPSSAPPWLVTTGHNRTDHPPTIALNGSPTLEVWERGSAVRVTLGTASWAKGPKDRVAPCVVSGPPLDVLEAFEGLELEPGEIEPATGGRSAIAGMGPGSRRRFMQKLSTLDRDAPGLFVTLTWPTWAAPSPGTLPSTRVRLWPATAQPSRWADGGESSTALGCPTPCLQASRLATPKGSSSGAPWNG